MVFLRFFWNSIEIRSLEARCIRGSQCIPGWQRKKGKKGRVNRGQGKTGIGNRKPLNRSSPVPRFPFFPFLRACAELVALEFEIETAAGKAKFTGGARDVAAMFSQSFRNHATLDFSQRIGKCEVLH